MKKSSYLFGPWHPPMTHFPITSSILAVFSLWIGFTYEINWLMKTAGVLWIVSFLTAFLSVLSGHLFADNLGMVSRFSLLPTDGPKTGQLRFHAMLGTIGLILSLFMLPGAWKLINGQPVHVMTLFFLGILAAILFGIGGHEGGEMVFKREMVPLSTFLSPDKFPWGSKEKKHKNLSAFKKPHLARVYSITSKKKPGNKPLAKHPRIV
jgi:uncharacterized membrane protein